MKKIILIVILSITTLTASAKSHWGVSVGYDHNWLVSSNGINKTSIDFDGLHVGPTYNYSFAKVSGLGIGVGLYYQFVRTKTSYDYSIMAKGYSEMHNLEIPLRVDYNLKFKNNWGLIFYAGPTLNFHLDWTDKAISLNSTASKTVHHISGNITSADIYGRKTKTHTDPMISCFDLGLGFGIGANWKGLSLRLGADFGLTNLLRIKNTGGSIHNHQLKLAVGYAF